MKLNKVPLGLALGFFWAGALLIFGVLSMTTGYLDNFVTSVGTAYIGYQATFLGILIGMAWAFVDAFVCGFIIAWLYNIFLPKK